MPGTDAARMAAEANALDRAGRPAEAVALLLSAGLEAEELLSLLGSLYTARKDRVAFGLAEVLARRPEGGHWLPHLVLAHLGIAHDAARPAATSLDVLDQGLAGVDEAVLRQVRWVLGQALAGEMVGLAQGGKFEKVLAYSDLLGGLFPDIRRVFSEAVSSDEIPLQKPLAFPDPEKPLSRRVVTAIRERYFPGDLRSRPHELGGRLVTAFQEWGWPTIAVPLRNIDHPATRLADFRKMAEACRETGAELVVVDEMRGAGMPEGFLESLIRDLRHDLPAIKVLVLYTDPWDHALWPEILRVGPMADAIWVQHPDLEILAHPELRGRVFLAPFPVNHAEAGTAAPLGARISFVGGLHTYNWPRVLWLALIRKAGLPVDVSVSTHADDGLPAIESSRRYMESLRRAGCCLNLAMRADGSRTLSGRAIEIPVSGALLVQERTSDLDFYLTPWEHYVPFTSLGDLAGVAALLRDEPERAEAVRRRGHAFARERYADARIVGYLDRFLADLEKGARP